MTAWKRNALRLFPERRFAFTSARNVTDILASLESDFLHSAGSEGEELGARMCEYLRESLRVSKHDDFERRVIHEYLVHWGSDQLLRELVFRVLSHERFLEEREAFEERLEPEDFANLWATFVASRLTNYGSAPPPANTR